jgi:hypothetical protein
MIVYKAFFYLEPRKMLTVQHEEASQHDAKNRLLGQSLSLSNIFKDSSHLMNNGQNTGSRGSSDQTKHACRIK